MLVIKRNGDTEPFAAGRIALAVFRAAQAQRIMPITAAESRSLGAEVSRRAAEKLALMGSARLEIESIQDVVVEILTELHQNGLADAYHAYRSTKNKERGRVGVSRKPERNFRFARGDGKVVEVSRDAWANVLSSALLRGAQKEWDVSSWWSSVKDAASETRSFDDFVGFHIKVLLERSEERIHWLPSASALLLERWYFRVLGVGPLLNGTAEASKALRQHYKAYWANRKVVQPASWYPSSKELDVLAKALDARLDHALAFPGLVMLEQDFGGGELARLPQEVLADAACALVYAQGYAVSDADQRLRDACKLFLAFAACDLVPPLSLMRQAGTVDPCLTQESSIPLLDSLESIFSALSVTASLAKSGSGVSVELGALRAEGTAVGLGGQVSGGIAPILRLFGEACGMLRGLNGAKQKARLFLPCWHRDLESFLAYSKLAPKELRLGVLLSDAFMKKVFEGGDWVLASPSEATHLLSTKGVEHEKWIREYSQMAKFGGLGLSTAVPARDVFSWICDAIVFSGGPSVVFPDACLHFSHPQEFSGLTSRMAGIVPNNRQERVSTLELGWRCRGELGDASMEHLVFAHEVLSRISLRDGGKLIASVAPVGNVEPGAFASLLSRVMPRLSKIGGDLPKGSLWHQPNPWESKLRMLEQSRGGYLTKTEDAEGSLRGCERQTGPPSVISLSAREEYLWLAGEPPIFVNHEQYRSQVRFEGVRAGFGGSGSSESMSKQIKRAAGWQKWSDGPLALDIRLEAVTAGEVAEAVKTAWLFGLPGVRRFVGQRVDSVS